MDSDMHKLPDGSGFWVQTIGERPPGFIYWLQAKPNGRTRRWYYFWLNYKTARDLGGPDYGVWKSLRWAWAVS